MFNANMTIENIEAICIFILQLAIINKCKRFISKFIIKNSMNIYNQRLVPAWASGLKFIEARPSITNTWPSSLALNRYLPSPSNLNHKITSNKSHFKPIKPNGISHSYQLDQSISVLRVVDGIFQLYSNFSRTFCKQKVETLLRVQSGSALFAYVPQK